MKAFFSKWGWRFLLTIISILLPGAAHLLIDKKKQGITLIILYLFVSTGLRVINDYQLLPTEYYFTLSRFFDYDGNVYLGLVVMFIQLYAIISVILSFKSAPKRRNWLFLVFCFVVVSGFWWHWIHFRVQDRIKRNNQTSFLVSLGDTPLEIPTKYFSEIPFFEGKLKVIYLRVIFPGLEPLPKKYYSWKKEFPEKKAFFLTLYPFGTEVNLKEQNDNLFQEGYVLANGIQLKQGELRQVVPKEDKQEYGYYINNEIVGYISCSRYELKTEFSYCRGAFEPHNLVDAYYWFEYEDLDKVEIVYNKLNYLVKHFNNNEIKN